MISTDATPGVTQPHDAAVSVGFGDAGDRGFQVALASGRCFRRLGSFCILRFVLGFSAFFRLL
jgi:hypothetical protein